MEYYTWSFQSNMEGKNEVTIQSIAFFGMRCDPVPKPAISWSALCFPRYGTPTSNIGK